MYILYQFVLRLEQNSMMMTDLVTIMMLIQLSMVQTMFSLKDTLKYQMHVQGSYIGHSFPFKLHQIAPFPI